MKMLKSVALCSILILGLTAGPVAGPAHARSTGITLDSEYLVFIVDTSGSMRRYEWERVEETILSTLDAHPNVAGIQVLNDEGRHLFLSYTGEWIPDTPEMRRDIVARLGEWEAFSNSNPRRGILEAIDLYGDPAENIALYILGDDFSLSSSTVQPMITEIDARNRDEVGNLKTRINAVAFPIYFDVTGGMGTGADYADLMLALTQHNGGSFIALPGRASDPAEPREPITGLRTGLDRSLILVDASVFMADERWQQAVATAEDIVAGQAGRGQLQLVVLGGEVRVLSGDETNPWVSIANESALEEVFAALRAVNPSGDSSLDSALAFMNREVSGGDNVYLLTSGLPTISNLTGEIASTDSRRYSLFRQATSGFPPSVPVNILLLGSDDRLAGPAYWELALTSGGSMVSVARDWP